MKLILSKFYDFLVGMHRVRAATSLARTGHYAQAKALMLGEKL